MQHTFFLLAKNNFSRATHVFGHFLAILYFLFTFSKEEMFVLSTSCSNFFFTAAHFHVGSRKHFSFSHRCYIIFMFFLQQNWSPLWFICRSSSFSVIQVNVDIKIKWKERLSFLLFVFSSLKVWLAMWFTAETSRVLEMQTLTSAITYSSPDGLTPDSFPLPQSLYGRCLIIRWRHDQFFLDRWITKFSKLCGSALACSCGAPLLLLIQCKLEERDLPVNSVDQSLIPSALGQTSNISWDEPTLFS